VADATILTLSKKLIAISFVKNMRTRRLKSEVSDMDEIQRDLRAKIIKFALAKGIQKRFLKQKEQVVVTTEEQLRKSLQKSEENQNEVALKEIQMEKM
jgi:hypothetical protein